jgi:RNA polymerase sigma-B factor
MPLSAHRSPSAAPTPAVDPRFFEYRASGERAIRNALVEDHRWLGRHCARPFRRKGVATDDLHQVAMLGLVKSVDRFDPDLGFAFTTFAVPTITGELRRHFRDTTWIVRVRRRSQENYLLVKQATDDLEQAFGRSPTVAELEGLTGLATDEVLEALDLATSWPFASLDARDDEDDAGGDDQTCLAFDEVGYARCEARLLAPHLLELLPTERDRRIIRMRFVDGLSQSSIGAELGLSQVQISRLLRANLDLMRRHLAA